MGTALVIGLAGALGCLALGYAVFVVGKPPPARPVARGSVGASVRGAAYTTLP